ncbi:MAG TPA: hypothetical protein VHG92_02810 [Afifellaceae bacterium]|nr:hypothetical protein [Afifellaceae bacterium]
MAETPRQEHLAWCKERALQILAAGDREGAIASMLSDLQKADEPLYDPLIFKLLAADGMLFCDTPEKARNWIEGFN